jgi:hypothetical protein
MPWSYSNNAGTLFQSGQQKGNRALIGPSDHPLPLGGEPIQVAQPLLFVRGRVYNVSGGAA